MPISLDDLNRARDRLTGHVHLTPIQSSSQLSGRIGCRLHFKCENLQKTGSFKVRGALSLMSQLDDEQKQKGVVTISAGNHAQAVAWAAAKSGTRATVVMPQSASPAKVEASRGYGAEVILHGDVFAAFAKAHSLEAERDLTFVHPFDDERIIAGAASVGMEILEQVADVDLIVVPIGGGGLIAGIATAVRQLQGEVRVYGVEPVGAAAMRKSLDEGAASHIGRVDTIADGLAPPMAGEINYEIVKDSVEDVVLVSDDEIIEAMRQILSRAKLLVEPSGAASTAALLAGKIPIKPTDRVVAVLSGGNVGLDAVVELLDRETGGS